MRLYGVEVWGGSIPKLKLSKVLLYEVGNLAPFQWVNCIQWIWEPLKAKVLNIETYVMNTFERTRKHSILVAEMEELFLAHVIIINALSMFQFIFEFPHLEMNKVKKVQWSKLISLNWIRKGGSAPQCRLVGRWWTIRPYFFSCGTLGL